MTDQFKTIVPEGAAILRLAERIAKEAHDLPAYASDDERGQATIVAGLAQLEKTREKDDIARELMELAELYMNELASEYAPPPSLNPEQQVMHLLRGVIRIMGQRAMPSEVACEACMWAAGRLLADTAGVRLASEAAYRLADALAAAEH